MSYLIIYLIGFIINYILWYNVTRFKIASFVTSIFWPFIILSTIIAIIFAFIVEKEIQNNHDDT